MRRRNILIAALLALATSLAHAQSYPTRPVKLLVGFPPGGSTDVIGQVKAGRLNAVAVTTPKRSQIVPELPTLAESGFPAFSFSTWQAVVGPAGLPREVVQRVDAEIVKAMATQEMKDRFLAIGTDAATSTPEELGRFLADEVLKIKRIATSVGATTN